MFKEHNNPIMDFDEKQFRLRYRFSKEHFTFLVHYLDKYLRPGTQRSFAIDSNMQLAVALRFYATGSFYNLVGDQKNISISSVCRIVRKVSKCIAIHLLPEYIKMPQNLEIRSIKQEFYEIANFPGVIGCIDCTHIPIQSPGRQNGELYRNRKGFFSLNVQAVCDPQLKIINLVARWRGAAHDSTIFDNSRLRAQFENGEFGDSFLLGDSGYPCRKYLLTPVLNVHSEAEQKYNDAHIATRNTIERCFGVVKRRFPCLRQTLRTKLSTTMSIICATFTLHNVAIDLKDEIEEDESAEIVEVDVPVEEIDNRGENNAARNHIIRRFFF